MTNTHKQPYTFCIILGIVFTLYATYALLSYNFPITFICVALGFTLLGVGIYKQSEEKEYSHNRVHSN